MAARATFRSEDDKRVFCAYIQNVKRTSYHASSLAQQSVFRLGFCDQASVEVIVPPGGQLAHGTDLDLPPGASRPMVARTSSPRAFRESPPVTATVALDVDEKGEPVNLKVEKTSDEGWAREVAAAVREWKFRPAQKDGGPLSVPCRMEFVRGE